MSLDVRSIIADSNANAQANSRRGTGFDVTHGIADEGRSPEIEIEIGGSLQYHARSRLTPRMIRAIRTDAMNRMIWAVIDPRERRIFCLEALAHPTCQFAVGPLVEIPAPDAGLIGYDHD